MKYLSLSGIMLAVLAMTACRSNNSYSTLQKAEKKLIETYIAVNDLKIVQKMPEDEEFLSNPKLYYEVPGYDYFYYRLEKLGNIQGDSILRSEAVTVRYKKYDLTSHPDTISCWTTLDSPYGIEFRYLTDLSSSSPVACTAWHVAVGYMKYSGSECKLIVPSKCGFEADKSSVTPYGYTLKMKFHP